MTAKDIRDHTGKRVGMLRVLERVATPGKKTKYRCICDCGNATIVASDHLGGDRTRSCGCLHHTPPPKFTHGHSYTPTYQSWRSMMRRCLSPTHGDYPRWGARGITVCERWRKFENFLADMGERPSGTTIDRYPDNEGDYEPGNCRWATDLQQQNNRRDNRLFDHNGETHTVTEWARIAGMPVGRVYNRLAAGWPFQRAVFTPIRSYERHHFHQST